MESPVRGRNPQLQKAGKKDFSFGVIELWATNSRRRPWLGQPQRSGSESRRLWIFHQHFLDALEKPCRI
jgi:hypothetical protein